MRTISKSSCWMQDTLQWVWAHCWVARQEGMRGKESWKVAILFLQVGELAWKAWEMPGFPKAVGKQGRGVVCAGDRQDMENTACPGCVEEWSAACSWNCFHRQQCKVWSMGREHFSFQGHCGAHISRRSQEVAMPDSFALHLSATTGNCLGS